MIKKENNKKEGFTLVETMVTVVVFTAVMSLSLGVFLSNIRTQRAALYKLRLVNETSYALKKIEEEIRNGDVGVTEINENYIEDLLPNQIEITELATYIAEEIPRITILLKTRIKTDENRYAKFELQTTVINKE
jgi:prepilin-type N-terminal cleavage/methylation domain-containing protein